MSKRLLWTFAGCAAFILVFFGACERSAPVVAPTPTRAFPAVRGVLSAPVSVTVDYARTFVVQHYEGGGEIGGSAAGEAWTDLYLFWQHPDPVTVDYYEVYTTTNVPYFTVPVSATLALTTTAQGGIFLEAVAPFKPTGGTTSFRDAGDFAFFAVRAVNAAGASEASHTMGVISYSTNQSVFDPEHPPAMPGGEWPTPRPTAGPSPTPVPTNTLTPVPTGTPGPSPTP